MTNAERNLLVLGRLLAISEKAEPALKAHFHKFINRPQILYAQMGLNPRVNEEWLKHPDLTALIDASVEPQFPSFASPEQCALVITGYHSTTPITSA